MQSDNRFFDDAAKLASGAIGSLAGLRREIEAMVRQQLERLLARMDLVTRDEFEAVKEMAAKARTEQEDLLARIADLEAKVAAKPRAKPKKSKSDTDPEAPER
jgi:BMFP domain-containing protein YqiC